MTRRWRLFPKYALLIITLVGSMLVASGAIGIYFSWRENEAHLKDLQAEKAQNAAYRIEQYIVDIEHELSWTALPRAEADGDALESRRIEYLKLQRQAPAITEVVWIDPNGREQLRISRLAMDAIGSGTDMTKEDKFRGGSTGVYYGPVYFRKGTEPYMTIARPAGSGGGVTAAEVNLKFVWDVVSRIKIGTGTAGLAYVVDANGVLIAHPDISLVLKKSDLSMLPQVAAVLNPGGGRAPVARDLKGDEVFAASASIPTLHWTVFVESPRTEAFAPLYATLQRTSMLLVAALLISIAASFFLARALVRPLRALQEGAAQIGAGDLERHIEVRTGDELEGLAEQFNRMSAQLRESYAGLERKVEQRTAELTESLEYQTATAEILKVISSSPDDVQPILEAVAERSRILCRAQGSRVWLAEGHQLRAHTGYKLADGSESGRGDLLPQKATSVVGQAFVEARTVLIDDVKAMIGTHYPDSAETQARHHFHSVLAVPMLREGEVVGVIAVLRARVEPFSKAEIRLVETFADQALIAIENVRLFNETREALEQQTATAEVLGVISGSVADSKPVFEKILESCQRLFESNEQGILLLGDDNQLHLGAHHGGARAQLEKMFPIPRAVGPDAASRERSVLHLRDVLGDADVPEPLRDIAKQIGVGTYSQVIAPMLWEGDAIGSLYVIRQPAVGFSDKEIGLLRTFADQAVIAIQNARLFNETKEALEQQTATADVLQVISGALADTQPVFERILDSCERLFNSTGLGMYVRADDGTLRMAAFRTKTAKSAEILKLATERPGQEGMRSPVGAAIRECSVLHYSAVPGGQDAPDTLRHAADRISDYSIVIAPLLRAGSSQGAGALLVFREPARPFAARELELIRTFADQAVIAIQNSRLFNETREALRKVEMRTAELSEALDYQTAISDVLRVISQSPTDVAPVFEAILDSAFRLFDNPVSAVFRYDGRLVHLAATRNWPAAAIADASRFYPGPPNPKMMSGRVILSGRVQNEEDALNDPTYDQKTAGLGLWRRMIGAPLLRDGQPIGAIIVCWPEPGVTPARQADLLKTFADQGVIAIENVRLLSETTEALEQQTATAEVLQVISSSVADTAPVFDKILDSCVGLFDTTGVGIYLVDDEAMLRSGGFRVAPRASMELFRGIRGDLPRAADGSAVERVIRERQLIHYPSVQGDVDAPASMRQAVAAASDCSVAHAPMLWRGRVVGVLMVSRDPPLAFTDKELSLLKTFADQAVIAIQNARLFNETKEALEQQTATAEVLQVISSSVADTAPVFDKILDSCERLFAASGLGIYLVDEEGMLRKAGFRSAREKPERALAGTFPLRLEGTATEIAIRERRVVHFGDVLTEPGAPAPLVRIAESAGSFSIAFAPMLWEGRGVGAIQVSRDPPQPFSDKELTLLKTFADQAVIAIQNARLFNEIQAKSRELELANKHKSEFLANMSHELRTPLNAIIGFSEVLSEKMFGEVNDKQLEYLLDIHTSGHHLLSLINDILDLSKIEAGRMELDLATTNLPMLLDNCTTLVRERANRQGLVLALEVEDGLGDWVADIRKLKQVVINLLSNAVKFTPAGGKVTLRARRLENAVEIAVVDTGVGIAADQQALVFEEFRQAGGDYLRKSEGTGLGLSLAKRFVELHGGTMRVESAPGQGSTFAFVLPERVVEAV